MTYHKINQRRYKQWNALKQAIITEMLGDKCIQCGSQDNLEVDHIYHHEVSYRICNIGSERILRSELLKCQRLCKSCHIVKTRTDIFDMVYIEGRRRDRGSRADVQH